MSQGTLYERVKMTVSGTPGTGTFTLGSPVTDPVNGNYRSLNQAGVPNAATVSYLAVDGNNWEVGHGTYASSGTTLTRSVLYSSNSNSTINASSNTIVALTALANDYVSQQPMSVVMAAHDSLPSAQAAAQFVCTGTNDDVLINSVIDSLTSGGTINFMSGTYILGNTITIDRDWVTLRGEGNQHWAQYMTSFGSATQQSSTGAPGGAKFKQTSSTANGITIGQTISKMHGATASGAYGDDARHKGISIEKLYLSGPGDQPFLYTITVGGSISNGDSATVTITDSSITGSPITLTIPIVTGDNTTIVAAKIATAVTNNANLAAAGVTATSAVAVCTIQALTNLIPLPVYTTTNGSSITFTGAGAANPSYGTGVAISDAFTNARGQKGNSDICRITECSIIGWGGGIQIAWDTGHILDNNIQNINGFGIATQGNATMIRGNLVYDLKGPGIWVFPESAGLSGHMIMNNYIGSISSDWGITLANISVSADFAGDCSIIGNTIGGCASGCIMLGLAKNCTVTGNCLEATSGSAHGIQIGLTSPSYSSSNNVITGNSIGATVSTSGFAINLLNNSTNNVIANNVMTGSWNSGGNNISLNNFGGNVWGPNAGQIPQYNNFGFQVISGATGTVTQNQVAINIAGGTTLTLQEGVPGQQIIIKPIVTLTGAVISASSNVCPLNSNTPGTSIIAISGKFAILVFDGTNWQVVAGA